MYYEVSDEVAKSEDTPQITVGDGDIDTIAPVITLSADTETKVLQTTLTATVDDGCKIEYRIGEFGLWKEYTEPIIASLNETYYFLAMDEEGNIGTNEITFANIDTSGVLLSTLWAQKGINPMGGNTTILYNEYTPLDPSVTPRGPLQDRMREYRVRTAHLTAPATRRSGSKWAAKSAWSGLSSRKRQTHSYPP